MSEFVYWIKIMEQPFNTPQPIHTDIIICPLCFREIVAIGYDVHLIIHERAEMLADILALSRH